MAGTVLKIDRTEVALGGSGGTVVNVTFRQESGMVYLYKGLASLGRRKAAAKDVTGGWRDYMAMEEADTPPVPEELGKEQNPT